MTTAVVESEFGYADSEVELVRSWAETWVSAWWWQSGQGRVYALVPADEVRVVVTPFALADDDEGSGEPGPVPLPQVNEDDTDWCSRCDETTVWDGEVCTQCGRVWGSE
jgi:hypothetical protein